LLVMLHRQSRWLPARPAWHSAQLKRALDVLTEAVAADHVATVGQFLVMGDG